MPIDALADALVDMLIEFQGESQAMSALLESHADSSDKRREFRDAILRHIALTLMLRSPRLHRTGPISWQSCYCTT